MRIANDKTKTFKEYCLVQTHTQHSTKHAPDLPPFSGFSTKHALNLPLIRHKSRSQSPPPLPKYILIAQSPHLLVVVFLHLKPCGVLRQRFDSLHPHSASGGVFLAHGVNLVVATTHAVDHVLPLPHEVLALSVQPAKIFRGIVQFYLCTM